MTDGGHCGTKSSYIKHESLFKLLSKILLNGLKFLQQTRFPDEKK